MAANMHMIVTGIGAEKKYSRFQIQLSKWQVLKLIANMAATLFADDISNNPKGRYLFSFFGVIYPGEYPEHAIQAGTVIQAEELK